MRNSYLHLPAALIGILAATAPLEARAQAGSYLKSIQSCTLQISGKSIPFKCRWMYDGISGGTIFVDNYDTGERYTVESYQWSTVGFVGDGKRACIKSPRNAIVCLIK